MLQGCASITALADEGEVFSQNGHRPSRAERLESMRGVSSQSRKAEKMHVSPRYEGEVNAGVQRRRVDKDEETAMFGEKTGERYANLYPDNWKQQSPAPEPHSRPLWPGPLQPGQRGRVMKAKKEKKKRGVGGRVWKCQWHPCGVCD